MRFRTTSLRPSKTNAASAVPPDCRMYQGQLTTVLLPRLALGLLCVSSGSRRPVASSTCLRRAKTNIDPPQFELRLTETCSVDVEAQRNLYVHFEAFGGCALSQRHAFKDKLLFHCFSGLGFERPLYTVLSC